MIAMRGPHLSRELLAAPAYLEPENSQQKILAVDVQYAQAPNGLLTEIRFYFPREVQGKPVIGPDEAKVKFHCQSGDKITGAISATFKVLEMTRNGLPDL